ncbi:ABC transporter permease [Streptomyces luteolus]|uniref:FtsX-like permease family protein n=1 Tax=Streptomyces luteolus TaxID=3043615 RepID=A0ABT6SR15_9ACTN|nr:FtsX-like permease family protein [Streptomyces sp. B-S-A12]MDI3418031.1 FtsX-like permease family protein [Streptomyces sp. B-S-A12]
MLRTALRNVLAHKARLIMTALAVMLGVAFVSGTLVFGDTVTSALRAASTKNLKDVDVSVAAEYLPGDGPYDEHRPTALDGKLADRVRELPGVASVRAGVGGSATLAGKDGTPVNADNSWQNLAANYVPGPDGKDPRLPLVSGRAPSGKGELALDAKTAEKAGYRIGDTVRFATTGPALTKKLVGTVHTDDPRVTAGGTLTVFDTPTAQGLFLTPGHYDEFSVTAEPGTDQAALTAKISTLLPEEGASATSGAELAALQSEQSEKSTESMTKMLLVFAGIALFVGVFIIANTFTMLIAQRGREIALMRAVGASRRQVVRSVLIEAGLLGLGASAAGFALGLGIAAGLRPLLNAGGAGLPDGPLVVGPGALLWSLIVGVLVTVLAAWLPSRKAAKIAPVEALSTVDAATPVRGMVVRNILGALLTGAGVAVMLYVSTLDDGDETNLMIAMLGSFLTLTGMIVLAPLLSRPLVSLAGRVTTRVFGVSGKLAKENALRNPRRTAATASALMIGLTLITGLTVAGHSVDRAMKQAAVQGLTADYSLSNSAYLGLDPKLGEKVADVPGVAAATPVASTGVTLDGEYAMISGVDPEQLGKVASLTFDSGSADDLGPGEIAISTTLAKRTGLGVGDRLTGEFTPDGEESADRKRLKVVGVYQENQVVDSALARLDDVLPYAMGGTYDSVLVKAEPGKATGLDRDLREALGNSPLLKVQSQEQLTKEESGAIDVMLNMMYGLLGMAVVIAVLGVINTLAMSVFERTREIGMLRAIGLDRKGVRQMVRLESVVISVFGALLGIGTGVFLAWAGGSLTAAGLPDYTTTLPWDRLSLFLALALVIGVLAAIWPARRAARLNMLGAINAQ